MNKTQLIEAVADSSQVSKEDVKSVIEHLATVGHKVLKEVRRVYASRLCEILRCHKAGDRSPEGHQPLHERADGLRGKTSQQSHQGATLEGGQRRRLKQRISYRLTAEKEN